MCEFYHQNTILMFLNTLTILNIYFNTFAYIFKVFFLILILFDYLFNF